MSTSTVSFGSSFSSTGFESPGNQIQQKFKQLTTALAAGDLSAARRAFSALQEAVQFSPSDSQGPGDPAGSDPVRQSPATGGTIDLYA